MSGPVKLVSERLADALKNGGSNLKGVGSTLEGIDLNQFMYEFVLDKAWNSGQTDKEWFLKLADRRTGKVSPEAVSYTHLDVYKRQGQRRWLGSNSDSY